MPLPPPFKPETASAYWNGRDCTVSMTELVITKYSSRSHTKDRLYVFTALDTGEVIVRMTGDAWDKFVLASKDRLVKAIADDKR